MGTYSSITCYEEAYTANEVADINGGINASVVLRCDWGDRYLLMDDLLATPQPWPKTTGLTPFAVSCACRPDTQRYTASGQECVYTDALVTVNYSTQIIDIASESLEPYTDTIILDHRRFRWGSGTPVSSSSSVVGPSTCLLEGEAPPYIRRCLNIVRTRYRLTSLPTAFLSALEGVNQYAYASSILGLTFDAETLMFQPLGAQRTFTNFSSSGWTASCKFAFNPAGWNTYWRAETQQFEPIYLAGSASRYIQHPLVDYSTLFA